MKLKKYEKNKEKKVMIISILVIVFMIIGTMILYKSYAAYQEKKDFDVIKGQVPEFGQDIQLAYTINGAKTNEPFPSKESGYSGIVTCSGAGISATWNRERWSLDNVVGNGQNKIKCNIDFVSNIMQGTEPKIDGDLIAVNILDNGTVLKADATKNNWYDYANKRWANAVILKDKTIDYNIGDQIPEDNIESYFVWIPKYRYKLWNVVSDMDATNATHTEPFAIDIILGDYNTTNKEGECVAPGSGEIGSCHNGDYMTHPAFTSLGVTGLWVGKFETGNDNGIIIKPNVTSWREIKIKTMFETSYNYKRELESHMMKNTEWGAVAYLSHSIYGINKEIAINNNSDFKTGYATTDTADQSGFPGIYGTDITVTVPYNNEAGIKASTTGNISGVYDMSGGAFEYVASFISGNLHSVNSGFETETSTTLDGYNLKYFDVYDSRLTSSNDYMYRILGDATGELGPHYIQASTNTYNQNWYGDHSNFVESANSWITRGGYLSSGVLAGPFSFGWSPGIAYYALSFRVTLAF